MQPKKQLNMFTKKSLQTGDVIALVYLFVWVHVTETTSFVAKVAQFPVYKLTQLSPTPTHFILPLHSLGLQLLHTDKELQCAGVLCNGADCCEIWEEAL